MKLALILLAMVLAAASVRGQCPAEYDKVFAAGGATGDEFGTVCAIDGDYMVVGAPLASTPAGAASVYRKQGASWVFQQDLQPLASSVRFGSAVDISGDTIVVGAPLERRTNSVGAVYAVGVVYVFRRTGSIWNLEADLVPPDASQTPPLALGNVFGADVAIDGDTLVAGASGDNERSATPLGSSGAAYAYVRSGSSWGTPSKIFGSGINSLSFFGSGLDLDGGVLAVVSSNKGCTCVGTAMHVFAGSGKSWSEVATLDSTMTSTGGGLGSVQPNSVSVSGQRIASQSGGGQAPRGVLLFERIGGVWTESDFLTPSDGVPDDGFGLSVSMEGGRVLVGAPLADPSGADSGAAYLYELESGQWLEKAKYTASDGQANDHYGKSVALSGLDAMVGADQADGVAADTGAVYANNVPAPLGLTADVSLLSTLVGGTQNLMLDAGAKRAGEIYLMLGSASGKSPGLPLVSGAVLPLNVDPYFLGRLSKINTAPLFNALGTLDANGQATAQFVAPPGTIQYIGLTLHHAYVILDPANLVAPQEASNAVSVTLTL